MAYEAFCEKMHLFFLVRREPLQDATSGSGRRKECQQGVTEVMGGHAECSHTAIKTGTRLLAAAPSAATAVGAIVLSP